MKINNSNNTAFGRAIRIYTDTAGVVSFKKANSYTMQTISTMFPSNAFAQDDTPSLYDKETSRQIGEFLKGQIGDSDPEIGVCVKEIRGFDYLFTGEDAKKAQNIIKDLQDSIQESNEQYKKDLKNAKENEKEKITNEHYKNIELLNKRKNEQLLKVVEDGKRDKPDTRLYFTFNNKGRLKGIAYTSFDKNTSTNIRKFYTVK